MKYIYLSDNLIFFKLYTTPMSPEHLSDNDIHILFAPRHPLRLQLSCAHPPDRLNLQATGHSLQGSQIKSKKRKKNIFIASYFFNPQKLNFFFTTSFLILKFHFMILMFHFILEKQGESFFYLTIFLLSIFL